MADKTTDPFATLMGTFYPRDHVVAVLPDDETAERALTTLREAGWSADEVHAYSGAVLREWHASLKDGQSVLERLSGALSSDETIAEEQYLDEAARGRAFLAAHADTPERAREVAAALAPLGAYAMRHYGAMTLTDLLPPGDSHRAATPEEDTHAL